MSIASTDIAPAFLDDHFSQLYENIVSLGAPIVSTPDYLRRTRKSQLLRYVNSVLNIPYSERERLLDPLVDYALSLDVSNPEAMENAIRELRKKFEDNPQFGQYFTKLERTFDSLNPRDRRYVLKRTVTNIKTRVESIRLMISEQIIKNPLELVLLDQIFYLIQEFSNVVLSKLEKPKEQRFHEIGVILILTLKLEAVRRGKITIKDVEGDVALESIFIRPKHVMMTEEVSKSVLTVVGE